MRAFGSTAVAVSLLAACSGGPPSPAAPQPSAAPSTTAVASAAPSVTPTASVSASASASASVAAAPAPAPMEPPLDAADVPARLRVPAPQDPPLAGKDRYGDALPASAVARLGTTRWRVVDPGLTQRVLTFAADGSLHIAQRVRSSPVLRDAATGKQIAAYAIGSGSAAAFAVSPNGRFAAEGCNHVSVIDLVTKKRVQELALPAPPSGPGGAVAITGRWYFSTCVAFSGDGSKLIAAMDEGTHIWSTATGQIVTRLDTASCRAGLGASNVAMSKNGAVVACAKFGALVLDAVTGKALPAIKGSGSVYSVALSDDGSKLVTGGSGNVSIWTTADGALVKRIVSMPGETVAVAISKDGKLVAASTQNAVRVFDVASGRPVPVPSGHEAEVHEVAFAPDGKAVATGGWDGRVLLWEPRTGKLLRTIEEGSLRVSALAWSKKGDVLATATSEVKDSRYASTVRLYGGATFALVRSIELTGYTDAIDFAADGSMFAAAGTEGALRFVKVADGTVTRSAPWDLSRSRAVALTADGTEAFVGLPYSTAPVRAFGASATPRDTTIGWSSEKPLREYVEPAQAPSSLLLGLGRMPGEGPPKPPEPGHEAGVHDIAVSPDGQRLLTVARSAGVFLWGLKDAKVQRCWAIGAEAAAFDPTGQRIVLGGGAQHVRVFSASAGARPSGPCTSRGTEGARSNPGGTELTGHEAAVNDVAVSPDGKLIASASDDGTVLIWNMP